MAGFDISVDNDIYDKF